MSLGAFQLGFISVCVFVVPTKSLRGKKLLEKKCWMTVLSGCHHLSQIPAESGSHRKEGELLFSCMGE